MVVGLPDAAVKESKDRVKSAIKNSGYEFPTRRITINLAPADIRKEGAAFDLPMAVGLLTATGLVPLERSSRFLLMGELSLDGCIKPVRGVLPVAAAARRWDLDGLILPAANAEEGALADGLPVYPAGTLGDVGATSFSHPKTWGVTGMAAPFSPMMMSWPIPFAVL